MIQRIALYTVLGLVLNAVEVQFNTWAFWSIVALFWASETMTRRELIEQLQEEVAAARAAAGLDNNKDTTRND